MVCRSEPRRRRPGTATGARFRRRYGIDPAAVVIGSVVRLVEGKGLHDLLRAFAVVGQQSTAELLLVGGGTIAGGARTPEPQPGMQDRVHLVGQHDDPYPFLDAMDVFVLAVPAGSCRLRCSRRCRADSRR